MENEIAAGVFLFQNVEGSVFLKAVNPPEYVFDDEEFEIIVLNCFPATDVWQSDAIYCFTTHYHFCYTWCFSYKEEKFSLVVSSGYLVPSPILRLLAEQKSFGCDTGHPLLFLDNVYNTLMIWELNNDVLNVQGEKLSIVHRQRIDDEIFDPCLFFEAVSIEKAWRTLFSGGCLVVKADTPNAMTWGVFCCLALMKPFVYMDRIFMFVNDHNSVLNDSFVAPSLVGLLTGLKVAIPNGAEVITVTTPKSDTSEVRREWRLRTKQVQVLCRGMFNQRLTVDPLCELMGIGSMIDDLAEKYGNEFDDIITIPELKLFEQTRTYQVFRRDRRFRGKFRDCFLSFSAEEMLSNRDKHTLGVAVEKLKEVKESQPFKRDHHVICRCRVAIHLAKRMIKKMVVK